MINLETGDLILIDGTTGVARIIDKVMTKYAEQEGIVGKLIFSHAMTVVTFENETHVAEAVENGFRIRRLSDHYYLPVRNYAVFRPKAPYSYEEKVEIRKYALHLQAVNNFYEYWALLFFIPYVYCTFKWKGKRYRLNLFGKGNLFSVYCYEGAYRIGKRIRYFMYPKDPEVITVFDLQVPDMVMVEKHIV